MNNQYRIAHYEMSNDERETKTWILKQKAKNMTG